MTGKTKKLMMPKEIQRTNTQAAEPQQDVSLEVDTDSQVQKKAAVQLEKNIAKRRAERDFIVTGRVGKQRKKQITFTIHPDLLSQVDEAAENSGLSRSSYMNTVLAYAVTKGLTFGK